MAIQTAPTAPTASTHLSSGSTISGAVTMNAMNAGSPRPRPRPVHELIRERARQRPDALAIVDGERRLSFAELDAASDALAARLAARGAGPEVPVGVSVKRSAELFVALLAVMKSGAAFVPLDCAYPRERLDYIAADGGIALWLVGPGIAASEGFDPARVMAFETLDPGASKTAYSPTADAATAHAPVVADIHERQLAYLIYTSGSTGAPKGVAVEHGPLSMHCQAIVERYGVVDNDVVLHFASVNFDGAHEGWLAPLIAGAAIVVSGDKLWDAAQTVDAVQREGITVLAFPPAYLRQVAEWCAARAIRLSGVRSYTTAGEAMSRETHAVIEAALAPPRLVNGYGPTETVITPLLWTSDDVDGLGDSAYLPIGTPVGERHVALDPQDDGESRTAGKRAAGPGQPAQSSNDANGSRNAGLSSAAGVAQASLQTAATPADPGRREIRRGELLIGGYGLARGYHRRAALTAERFEPDPDGAPGSRRYRSGDIVEALPGGGYAYLGRTDDQIKLRGLRIEPGEIERCLLGCEGVREAAVVVRETAAGRQLVGYLAAGVATSNEAETEVALPNIEAVRARLEAQLPAHMIPASLVALRALPRMPNGKLDRAALPAPELPRAPYRAPSGEVEQTLAGFWSTLLNVMPIGAEDHFFELGGNSLLAASLQARVRERLQADFAIETLFEAPRLADLARRIDGKRDVANDEQARALAEIDALLSEEERN
ncbi:non-ribosomal peptide synthetase component F [Paraburkholderia bannensis]|uniref:Non-ribosomal peptide synthetase component F n=1 Tax=Paraburkholderia bannensis TaxID=765414 RepID=A0A7W9TUY7_9BURK|nr:MULTISPECIES: AMP-binding protein [Paraburkholderia]MBB3256958.1 non-ribosomal peptide synthetase component F [Paraburkholderia sp. WP4_3_2]MBB6101912.1 non-ribosomal peptide synthetase component F [Paraburkholderia bannensis]